MDVVQGDIQKERITCVMMVKDIRQVAFIGISIVCTIAIIYIPVLPVVNCTLSFLVHVSFCSGKEP